MSTLALAPTDAFFLLAERERMPFHAAAILEFTLPGGDTTDYLRGLRERMRADERLASPWNLIALPGALKRAPMLREVSSIDIDQHVILHQLPAPGGQRALGQLVGALHAQMLPRDRPLWEMHLIDGLGEGRFAIYIKLHHAIIDGVSAMRRMAAWLSTDPGVSELPPLFAVGPPQRSATRAPQPHPLVQAATLPLRGVNILGDGAAGLKQLAVFMDESRRGLLDGDPLATPYRRPAGLFRGEITAERRIAVQQLDLNGVKAAARAAGGTVNDIMLWITASALRTYLSEQSLLPDSSLNAGCAVNLRSDDDNRPGSSFGFLTVDLATNIADGRERLDAIISSSATSKKQLSKLGGGALAMQVVVAQGPFIGGLLLGLGEHTPAPWSVSVSNVPGPAEQLYLDGARLDTLVPVSIPMDNNPLNVTCFSHADKLTFGITAAATTVPHVQRVATAMAEAWDELSEMLLTS